MHRTSSWMYEKLTAHNEQPSKQKRLKNRLKITVWSVTFLPLSLSFSAWSCWRGFWLWLAPVCPAGSLAPCPLVPCPPPSVWFSFPHASLYCNTWGKMGKRLTFPMLAVLHLLFHFLFLMHLYPAKPWKMGKSLRFPCWLSSIFCFAFYSLWIFILQNRSKNLGKRLKFLFWHHVLHLLLHFLSLMHLYTAKKEKKSG